MATEGKCQKNSNEGIEQVTNPLFHYLFNFSFYHLIEFEDGKQCQTQNNKRELYKNIRQGRLSQKYDYLFHIIIINFFFVKLTM